MSNGSGMTLFERQRASLTRQHSNQTQQNCVIENQRIESHEMPLFNSLIIGSSVIPNQSIKIDQCFDHNSSNFRDFRLTGAEFAGDRVSLAPEIATSSFDVDRSLNSSCSPTTVAAATENIDSKTGRARLKKRKAEFSVVEDCKDNMINRESGEWESEDTAKSNRETSASTSKENSKDQKPDYIHVRARRGQATDSHSLAERARREKISKKMKCLQDLVPGCNKVTGKAGMLEEIINYVQSLQKQVEFLSMKLATSNPRLDFNIDDFLLKELTAASHSEMANLAHLQFNQAQQGGTSSNCGTDMLINCTQMAPQRIASSSMPFPDAYLDSSCFPQIQHLPAWETDLQSLYKTEFH